jgi:hypothetical protein
MPTTVTRVRGSSRAISHLRRRLAVLHALQRLQTYEENTPDVAGYCTCNDPATERTREAIDVFTGMSDAKVIYPIKSRPRACYNHPATERTREAIGFPECLHRDERRQGHLPIKSRPRA